MQPTGSVGVDCNEKGRSLPVRMVTILTILKHCDEKKSVHLQIACSAPFSRSNLSGLPGGSFARRLPGSIRSRLPSSKFTFAGLWPSVIFQEKTFRKESSLKKIGRNCMRFRGALRVLQRLRKRNVKSEKCYKIRGAKAVQPSNKNLLPRRTERLGMV